ncbi:MAG: bifunctional methylenetetrahydrofolate dehydrogenase/methenyltetrahydrofolate cyclohydrolase FolD [Oscillospiraceae bacterium]|nr:bifunctional methylenetetrahydrofolate dehydrogenase/methenyltetrahydrofolate cyclohydrolase FolD [Oscillospiraceae bacterium]
MAKIMDGKAFAAKCKNQIREEAARLTEMGHQPGLAVVLVGENPASQVYVRNKDKDCRECGIYSAMYTLPEETSEEQLLELLDVLNHDDKINGILVQLPVPKHIDSQKVIEAIAPIKDVDAFHPTNVGYLTTGMPRFAPCTPAGIVKLMEEYGVDPAGKHCVVIGRSNIVGKPMALLLLQKNGTVTICHSKTPDLKEQCLRADILISAVGKTGFVTGDMVKEGAVVIDVAMNRNSEGKLCGDVVYEEVEPKASLITPVPGGVGPMTRVMLLENTLTACRLQNHMEDPAC